MSPLLDVLQIAPWWAYALLMCTALGLAVAAVGIAAAVIWIYQGVRRLLGHPVPPDPLTALENDLHAARADALALLHELAAALGKEARTRDLAERWRTSDDPIMRAAGYDLENLLNEPTPAAQEAEDQALAKLNARLRRETASA